MCIYATYMMMTMFSERTIYIGTSPAFVIALVVRCMELCSCCMSTAVITMANTYLAEILRIAPSTWTGTTYSSTNYATVQLEEYSEEYINIVSDLRTANSRFAEGITKIERVQHPFAYGRFVLRKEQLEKRRGYHQEPTRYFIEILQGLIKEAIEYNLDTRRTSYFSTYGLLTLRSLKACVVVVKGLGHPSSIERDSEIYPEYIVYYE